jgi:hypothetical protein
MARYNRGNPLPPCRLIDHDRVVAALTATGAAAIRFTAMAHGLSRIAAVAAVVPEGEPDLRHLMASPDTVHATWMIETDCIAEFLSDPLLRQYLRRGIAVVAVFEDAMDYVRLQKTVPALPQEAASTGGSQ